jgi:hypothetical protein
MILPALKPGCAVEKSEDPVNRRKKDFPVSAKLESGAPMDSKYRQVRAIVPTRAKTTPRSKNSRVRKRKNRIYCYLLFFWTCEMPPLKGKPIK